MNNNQKKIITALCLGLVWAFIAGELLTRAFIKNLNTPWKTKTNAPQYFRSVFARQAYQREPLTFYVTPTQQTYINEKGYRGKNFQIEKKEGVKRILFFGGSQVLDQYAHFAEDWPHLIEDSLKEKGYSHIEILNTAVSGNASFDSVGILWGEAHTFSPDYTVLCNMWNDLKYFRSNESLLREMQFKNIPIDPRIEYYNSIDKLLVRTSKLYLFLRTQNYKRTIGMEGLKPKGKVTENISEKALRQYRLNLEMFVDVSRNVGATPVLMTQPRLFTAALPEDLRKNIRVDYLGLTYAAMVQAADESDRIIHDVGSKKGVDVINTSSMYGQSEYYADHIHLSKAGSQKLSEIVSEYFMNTLK